MVPPTFPFSTGLDLLFSPFKQQTTVCLPAGLTAVNSHKCDILLFLKHNRLVDNK